MFIDEVEVTLIGGKGGDGRTSFLPGYKVIPDGGNGGRGGSIYALTSSDLTLLNQFTGNKKIKANDGKNGERLKRAGKIGQDITITLPVGSVLTEIDTHEVIDLNFLNQKVLICKGGAGGKGTWDLRTTNFREKFKAEVGHPGEKKEFKIEVKLIANYGLIGLPNAGKSSLLNELTRANAKVASYPFTTLEPNLGVMDGKILVDIPGLIEGASEGKGLGIKSLKHIEKVNLIIHCVSSESETIGKDYEIIRGELNKFNLNLTKKPELILLTKSDTSTTEELEKKSKLLQKYGKVITISIYDKDSLSKLKNDLLETA